MLFIDNDKKLISQQFYKMDTKASTDIDRKLAIYYHPLFQEIIKIILDLFQTEDDKFEIGLLQFVEFNLKLQKALLPTFQVDNALVSGLNDWVKQVAECLSYQGMVSTAGCVQVTPLNLLQLTEREYDSAKIKFYVQKTKYLEQIGKVSNHDAFKLLGVKINKQVFSKFMFDLCSTWCQFLDVELFSYFLIGLYIQISEGETIQNSVFRPTLNISTIDFEFMEQFEQIKSTYNKVRRKQLRYYRAWCEWNYLRVNQAGERLIVKLDELHPDDHRILQLAMVFQRAIHVINEQITNQNPQKQQKKRKTMTNQNNQENKQFLILKKLNIEPSGQKQSAKYPKSQEEEKEEPQNIEQYYQPDYNTGDSSPPQQFQIQIDQEGNMYLKRIVRLPVFGMKIDPKPFQEKLIQKREYLFRKKNQYREVSNLYRKMENLKVRLEHNINLDPYTFKKNAKIQQRDKFYEQNKTSNKRKGPQPLQSTIHQKVIPKPSQKQQKPDDRDYVKRQPKVSLRQNKQYIHKVMAPTFLTDDANNLSFAKMKQGQIYSNSANDEKREIKIGLPKLKNMQFRVKQMKSYHIVGKLINDRSLIAQKIKSTSFQMAKQTQEQKLENMKEQNKHIWSRYIDEQQMKQLTNYQQFYYKLQQAKTSFGRQFQSQYRLYNKLHLGFQDDKYNNKRYELGGILMKEDQERFSQRMSKLINKQNRKNKKKQRKQRLRQYRNNFKNKRQKSLYEDIFINYHRQALKDIREEKKRQSSMIVK